MNCANNGYLIHFGIKGQKWGVRRFQNDDGTLTPEGQERYNRLSDRQKKNFSKMSPKVQKKLLEDLDKGKSYSASVRESRQKAARRAFGIFLGMSLAAAGIVGAASYVAAKKNRERDEYLRESLRKANSALDDQMKKFRVQQEQFRERSRQFDDFLRSRGSMPINSIHMKPADYVLSSRDYTIR